MAFKTQGHGQQYSILKNNLHNKYQQKKWKRLHIRWSS